MSTSTTTVDITPVLGVYAGPSARITGPVGGVWTITADGALVDQAGLDFAVAEAAKDVAAEANRAALLAKAVAAQAGNATFLGIGAPTTAQTLAQVRALTRQVNALLKLAADDLANTSGT